MICSLALARLRSEPRQPNGGPTDEQAVQTASMAQKLLLFWRKPARRCWWEGVELDDVEGYEGHLIKVWIRRVWTLEMVSLCSCCTEEMARQIDIWLTVYLERHRTALGAFTTIQQDDGERVSERQCGVPV